VPGALVEHGDRTQALGQAADQAGNVGRAAPDRNATGRDRARSRLRRREGQRCQDRLGEGRAEEVRWPGRRSDQSLPIDDRALAGPLNPYDSDLRFYAKPD
jgi:hypothetical protein